MKKLLGYILFSGGTGILIGVALVDISQWKKYVILLLIIAGFAIVVEENNKIKK